MPIPGLWLVYYLMMAENDTVVAEGSTAAQASLPQPRTMGTSVGICIAGWCVPGMGHLLLGRWGRGVVFCIAILAMFGLGLAMNGRLYDPVPEQPLHVFAFFANAGTGVAYLAAQQLGLGVGDLSSPNYDYGSTYLWVAGLLNYLVVLDAFDIAQGRKK